MNTFRDLLDPRDDDDAPVDFSPTGEAPRAVRPESDEYPWKPGETWPEDAQ